MATRASGKTVLSTGEVRKPYCYRASTGALRKIRHFKTSTKLIHKFPFQCPVLDIAQNFKRDLPFQRATSHAFQEASEACLVGLFEDTNLRAIHAKHVTNMPEDIELPCRILGEHA
ncbi:histone H3.3A-like [Dasypus novemcinctus]|uniref:histone H3.3A-like n=1 Tax=Dasypus novemcinctus TaxID=9361 RepID=UPI00265F2189|nr:uncharacterized protein LOC131273144 [Dasypus novemcinctus]